MTQIFELCGICPCQILFLDYRKFQIFNLDGCDDLSLSSLYRISCVYHLYSVPTILQVENITWYHLYQMILLVFYEVWKWIFRSVELVGDRLSLCPNPLPVESGSFLWIHEIPADAKARPFLPHERLWIRGVLCWEESCLEGTGDSVGEGHARLLWW